MNKGINATATVGMMLMVSMAGVLAIAPASASVQNNCLKTAEVFGTVTCLVENIDVDLEAVEDPCPDRGWAGESLRFDYQVANQIRDPIAADGAYYPATWVYFQDRAYDNDHCITLKATCTINVGASDNFQAVVDYTSSKTIRTFTGEYKGLATEGGGVDYCARNALSFDTYIGAVILLEGQTN